MINAAISLERVSVEFPVFNSSNRSLKKQIIQAATGGRIAQDAKKHILIQALDDINLSLKPGDRLGLVGHNGSGKSTLLRVLAGAYTPTSGRISIQGRVASLLDIGLGMDGEASGYENIIVRGILMGMSKSEIEEKIKDIAEFTDLGDYLYMPMRTYSSGMAMRLGFAVSTSTDADIILMDEWLSVGDSAFNEKAALRMNDLLNRSAIMVFASHDMGMIEKVCNRAIKLEHGKIVEQLF